MFELCEEVASDAAATEGIRTAFPQTKVHLCIVHLVRAALKDVTDSDSREVATDLKTMYPLATVVGGGKALEKFGTKWDVSSAPLK